MMYEHARYRKALRRRVSTPSDLPDSFLRAEEVVRRQLRATTAHEQAILDVAVGVAGPVLMAYTIWLMIEARSRGIQRLRFLSREGQVLFEIARRLVAEIEPDLDLEYVYGNRLTWSLAAADSMRLGEPSWLFNSFLAVGPDELCRRLGLTKPEFGPLLTEVSLRDPDCSVETEQQSTALRRFLSLRSVREAAQATIAAERHLLALYCAQHQLLDVTTGIVDTGWFGLQIRALFAACSVSKKDLPTVLFWGYEPPATVANAHEHVVPYMYSTLNDRRFYISGAPFIMEMLCMSDHGTVARYSRRPDGAVIPVLVSSRNAAAEKWGLKYYRSALYIFADSVRRSCRDWNLDLRSMSFELLQKFWNRPAIDHVVAWGSCPYDVTPDGAVLATMARPMRHPAERIRADDPPWLAASLALGRLR